MRRCRKLTGRKQEISYKKRKYNLGAFGIKFWGMLLKAPEIRPLGIIIYRKIFIKWK